MCVDAASQRGGEGLFHRQMHAPASVFRFRSVEGQRRHIQAKPLLGAKCPPMPLLGAGRPSTPAIDLPPLFSDPPLPRASTAAALQGHRVRDRNGDAKSATGSGQARSMAPRVAELGEKLTDDAMQTKAVCSELAFLASRSMSACAAVADGRLESKLSRVLSQTSDPHLQCDVVGILSNCATASRASCARQAASIATLSALVASANPEVQHAAALHLATLSHSDQLSAAIGKSRTAMKTLRELELQASETLASPGHASLRQQAAQYARWALRTPRGFHLKPAFKPKPLHVQEHDSSVQLQARVRSSFVANQYRNEMKARRAAAAVVQASYTTATTTVAHNASQHNKSRRPGCLAIHAYMHTCIHAYTHTRIHA